MAPAAPRSCVPRSIAFWGLSLALSVAIASASAGRPSARDMIARVRTVATIATFPDVPESLATDGQVLYVSLFTSHELWRLDPTTGATRALAAIPDAKTPGTLTGVGFNPNDGLVYAAFKLDTGIDLFTPDHPDCDAVNDTVTGVYRWSPVDGSVQPFATRGQGVGLCNPDGLAIDGAGNVYVADIARGEIWKFDETGHGGIWSTDPLLGWTAQTGTVNLVTGAPAGSIGVNDLALSPDGRYLYAGTDGGPGWNTGAGLLVRIPVKEDGSAGVAALMASGLGCNDGVAVDARGTVFFSDTCNDDIWAFTPDASRRLLLASRLEFDDPLDNTAALRT